MVTYNSSRYVREQVDTILENLGPQDELIASDDGSSDNTLALLNEDAKKDPRIKVFPIAHAGVNGNYLNAISHCTGDFIFLSDGDNVWTKDKVAKVMTVFGQNPKIGFVMHDCSVTDPDLNVVVPSLFAERHSRPKLFKNVMRTSFCGSCMAFKKDLLRYILPFPKKMPVYYDEWIGLMALKHSKAIFLDEKLLLWRRYGGSASGGFLNSDGQTVKKKKARFKGSLKRFHERVHTRAVKFWWVLFR